MICLLLTFADQPVRQSAAASDKTTRYLLTNLSIGQIKGYYNSSHGQHVYLYQMSLFYPTAVKTFH